MLLTEHLGGRGVHRGYTVFDSYGYIYLQIETLMTLGSATSYHFNFNSAADCVKCLCLKNDRLTEVTGVLYRYFSFSTAYIY